MEGTGARYRIRAEDVKFLASFQILNYVGAELVCRINGDAKLRFAVARVSTLLEITRQLPFLFFLRKRIGNKVLDLVQRTLQQDLV